MTEKPINGACAPAQTLGSPDGKFEWRYEIRMLRQEFPACTTQQIEAALQKAIDSNAPGESHQKIELYARSELVFQSLFAPAAARPEGSSDGASGRFDQADR